MKTLILLLATVSCTSAIAQNFEGTMKWSMKTEIKDPAIKAQMEKANGPASQAQLKQFQEQMKDPEMKKMMESNPEMKAQMERLMKMAGDPESMMPRGFTIKFKNMNTLTKIEGGMIEGEILYLHEGNKRYQIDREHKTYRLMPQDQAVSDEKPKYKITPTSETAKILGYTCKKYLVEEEDYGKKVKSSVWVTNEIKGLSAKNFDQGMESGGKLYYKEIDGVPLRIEMTSDDADMVMEVVELKKESLKDSEFALPVDFGELQGN